MQNCTAILQYLGKSMDVFSSYLPTNKKPMDGGLATCRIATQFCNTWKNPWRDFLRTCRPLQSHGGRLNNMQNCYAILQSLKNPWRDFSRSYAAMEPRQYRPKGGMSVSEGRNGGGAKVCPVELAMAQNGRAIRTTVLKSTVQKITVKKKCQSESQN